MRRTLFVFAAVLATSMVVAQTAPPASSPSAPQKTESTPSQNLEPSGKIAPGSKLYIAPMSDGYENYLSAAMFKKQVPVLLVIDKAKADFELSGISESEKAGWAKMLFMGSQQTAEQASIKITDLRTGAVVFGYSVNKGNSRKGKQSSSEACAKHLKEKIESGK